MRGTHRKYRSSVREILGDRKFDGNDRISILGFLREFQLACDQIQLSGELVLWMIKNFVQGEPNSLIGLRMGLESMNTDMDQRTRLRSYCELVDSLLR